MTFSVETGSTGTQPAPVDPAGPARLRAALDALVRVVGGVVALAGAMLAAVLALILVPLRVELGAWQLRIPVAVLLAVAGNSLLLWFARRATGARWGVFAPVLGWFAVMLPALTTTAEGTRLMVPNDWVALLTLFAGTVVLTIGAVVALVAPTSYHG